ncbi:coiled-coil domain-containing protein 66 isoform X3 [Ornithorhynchus anatinus]|nr:coiled-coil domain-containing protein 66 isoform X3 [Ornithorhynchus anatinus]XP_039766156.1 coiled-coil domain-containing protein 66 isoform X3 [Ornithorhynchus anatinus]XP_039766157.1 coiled-coil domain-containing protein 66 isoform X3 [Ornithorhynchus anatinus]XP_039766158.1 coiled-coil domain-containing protein 66 isoform X3 [Ornithorhynchus anatinus]XP_039766159.1 coiled-coil domain-containing protein 66 isoform X3 [Ornithorhynchus anatinus]
MENKSKTAKPPSRTKLPENVLKVTNTTYVKHEKLSPKRAGSDTFLAKAENTSAALSSTKDLYKECANREYLHIQKDNLSEYVDVQKPKNTKKPAVPKQKPQKSITAEDLRSSLVCLTQEQLQQILTTVSQGTRPISQVEDEKKEETSESNLCHSTATNKSSENIMGLFQKAEDVSSDVNDNNSVLSKKQISEQPEHIVAKKNVWKPADIFSTLGERERNRSLLEAKKFQWRKELDEQVALKKKQKEACEEQKKPLWRRTGAEKIIREKTHYKEAKPLEHSFSAVKQEQQEKWIKELNKQREETKLRKTEEKRFFSKGEEHDKWAVHFDSLRNRATSQSPLSWATRKDPEYLCVSSDSKEMTHFNTHCPPVAESRIMPLEASVRNTALERSQKTSFLRSMTALLDPAQIEERERRRQKQLEHQKAITAQVEEKRKKKEIEEQQRKKEEQEEELRLAREREEMQKQFEADVLKQKQKEEIMTLKTNEMYQTMQRAQELAQRLKQEQRIRELTQKGHDTSKLLKNLGGGTVRRECNTSISSLSNVKQDCPEESSGKMNLNFIISHRKDTAVQTNDIDIRGIANLEVYSGPVIDRKIVNCPSPDLSVEFKGQYNGKVNKKELRHQTKTPVLEKENNRCYSDQYEQYARAEKHAKQQIRKSGKRPDWNTNQPVKRYIPASERYPKQLQKQREEKKIQRQMELLHLVERNTPEYMSQKRGGSSEPTPSLQQQVDSRLRSHRKEEDFQESNSSKERFGSPPIPAVKSSLHQAQRQLNSLDLPVKISNIGIEQNIHVDNSQLESFTGVTEPEWPASHFIPYIRTNEVYYLDPDAPMSRPSTHDPQNQHESALHSGHIRQLFSSDHVRDPLLNPSLVKNRDRQQAILKGLSELRQGLLQKQKELETSLSATSASKENLGFLHQCSKKY